jgi:serine/threonine protein phosphatase PrpC
VGVVIADPDIKAFRVQSAYDFVFIGCDGIFDKLSNKDIIDLIWKQSKDMVTNNNDVDIHSIASNAIESVLLESVRK